VLYCGAGSWDVCPRDYRDGFFGLVLFTSGDVFEIAVGRIGEQWALGAFRHLSSAFKYVELHDDDRDRAG
jgi:hypothetical protein